MSPCLASFDLSKVLLNPDVVTDLLYYDVCDHLPDRIPGSPDGDRRERPTSVSIPAPAGSEVSVWETLPGAPTGTQWHAFVEGRRDTATPAGTGR